MYVQRVREVERYGMAEQSTIFYKRLATLISTKREPSYNLTINWLRCQISFSLLRSAIQCIRGVRSSCHSPDVNAPFYLKISQTNPSNFNL